MMTFEELNQRQKAALEWQVERARLAQCKSNQLSERVGLAEKYPAQFRRQLSLAILSAPDAREKIDGFVMAYATYLQQYSRPLSLAVRPGAARAGRAH